MRGSGPFPSSTALSFMRCVKLKILSGVATGKYIPKQFPSYEELARSNFLSVIACNVGGLYELLKITLFQ